MHFKIFFFLYLVSSVFSLAAKNISSEVYTKKYYCQDKYAFIGSKESVNAWKSMVLLGKKLANENKIYFLNVGSKKIANAEEGTWCLNFLSESSLTKDEAFNLVKNISFNVLFDLYHNPCYRIYFEKSKLNTQISEKQVCFKLAFWDKNMDRPLYPYLAQIRLLDGFIYYQYADSKTQLLQEPIKESLESLFLSDYKK